MFEHLRAALAADPSFWIAVSALVSAILAAAVAIVSHIATTED